MIEVTDYIVSLTRTLAEMDGADRLRVLKSLHAYHGAGGAA